ncbi:Starch-binding associating with outer membrane [bacterium A37T11]|nr:Starch-binding associating with outer membrane [bacterium A37T11]
MGISSCDKYLDVNTDPNNPSEDNITAELVFPGLEMNLASSYGDFLKIAGGYFSEQYAQTFGTSNYLDYSQFTMSATRSSGTYIQLTSRVLKNLKVVRDLTSSKEEWGTYLAATTLWAFTYQVLVDAYGEIPYTEALDVTNVTPKFDDGITIYNGILADLDDALSKATPTSPVPSTFLFEDLNATKWIQFANALKLRILMRMSKVQDVKAQLDALTAENNFPTSDVAWAGFWTDASGQANPFYQEESASYFGSNQVNVIANLTLTTTMSESEDARLQKFFLPNKAANQYQGGVSGTNFAASATYKESYFCRPVSAYDDPVYLITVAETEFFLSEYAARYGSAADAETHYKAAITASFETAGATGAEKIYDTYYPYSNSNHEKVIGIQKWVALSGTNNFEAWVEMRRLKYPAFGSVTGTQIYNETTNVFNPGLYKSGTLYTPIKVNSVLGAEKVLQRFRYPESSTSRNPNAPADKPDSEPVFWGK